MNLCEKYYIVLSLGHGFSPNFVMVVHWRTLVYVKFGLTTECYNFMHAPLRPKSCRAHGLSSRVIFEHTSSYFVCGYRYKSRAADSLFEQCSVMMMLTMMMMTMMKVRLFTQRVYESM